VVSDYYRGQLTRAGVDRVTQYMFSKFRVNREKGASRQEMFRVQTDYLIFRIGEAGVEEIFQEKRLATL
jgi:hypothetical protein